MTGVSSRVGDWYRADPAQSCHCRWSKEATVQGFFETATTLSEEMPPDGQIGLYELSDMRALSNSAPVLPTFADGDFRRRCPHV